MTSKQKKMLYRIITAFVLFVVLMVLEHTGVLEQLPSQWLVFLIYLIPYLVIGYDIVYKAVRNISHGQVFDENFLMMVATFGAFGVKEYSEAVAVMLFYQVGELFQNYAVGKSRQSISDMMNICPEYANIEEDGFSVVILACIFFKSDRMTLRKVVGCVIGFAGILSLNLGGADSGRFTWLGDGMIILNALCGATASLLTRGLGKRLNVFVGTGYSLAIGGVILVVCGLLFGGTLPQVTVLGLLWLFLLICISTVGFTLYNKLLTCNPIGKVAIYNSLIPVVGAVSSCLCLHEVFYWKYVLAGALATIGIYIINKGK